MTNVTRIQRPAPTAALDTPVPRESRSRGQLPMLLTADETATLLRTTRKAIYLMAGRGQLPGVTKIGRRTLFRTATLLDWLDQKSAPLPKE